MQNCPGDGVMVGLWLRRVVTAEGLSPVTGAAATPVEATVEGGSVVLVDDDDLVRPVIANSLREAGFEVQEAANATEAISLVHSLPHIDLLISDVVMPGMDGPAMVARLRSERPDLRVLFITGHSGQHSLDGEQVLRKPFTNGELARAVTWSITQPGRRG